MRITGYLPPLFVFLLPLFFVLHGFNEYYDLVPIRPALLLLLWYLAASLVLYGVFFLLLKNNRKAGVMTIVVMGYQFFFGAIQDMFRQYFPSSFLNKYSFILPFSLLVLAGLFILLKKQKSDLKRFTRYLHVLFLALLLVDAISLTNKIRKNNAVTLFPPEKLTSCDSCPKPDIYLIVADGYPGEEQFREILHHDNGSFYAALRDRGFQITDSSISNYNFTFFSIASMLNLNYLASVKGSISDLRNIPAVRKAFRQGQLPAYLQSLGYRFYNYSHLDFSGHSSPAKPTFWINDTRPVSNQTFLSRLNRDLGFHLLTTFRIRPVNPYPRDLDLRNNELLYRETLRTAHAGTAFPKFVYTHLIMPHHPYYFDSAGKRIPDDSLTRAFAFNRHAAVQYITYANRKLLTLIDSIRIQSPAPPVILLMSDHGFREIREEHLKPSMFLNLQAIRMPEGEYPAFYKGMSNINFFRLFLNRQFKQALPLLKDSTIFLAD